MPGEPDPLYVRARRALLDAADALEAHLDAVVLVGAQAVYLQAGEADLLDAGAPRTDDFLAECEAFVVGGCSLDDLL